VSAQATRRDCPRCDGTGHVPDEDHGSPLCPDCDGHGVVYDDPRFVPLSEESRDCLALALHGRTINNEYSNQGDDE
jgi:DnaJ-class molecular chaperone